MDMSLPVAEFVSFWANWTLVAALVLGVVATYAIVISGNAKERHWADEKRQVAERVAANEATTARAQAEAAGPDRPMRATASGR